MSDMQRVEIREDTENPTIEEQSQSTEEAVEIPERPEWLPEKFTTAEDMAKAYGELESKLSSGDSDDEQGAEQTGNMGALTADDMQKYSDEWSKGEGLSEDTYEELANKYGADKTLVDQYIQGQYALAQGMADRIYGLAGGEESYGNMIEWAKSSLDDGEIQAFDRLMDQGDEGSMQIAVRGLYARYISGSDGKGPTLLQGKTSSGSANAFRSIAELRKAMADSRYKDDPAYRKDVEQRLAVSNIL